MLWLNWPTLPARLRAAPLLSFDQGGSIALELASKRRIELTLPRSMAYFTSPEEAAAAGAAQSARPGDLAASFEVQLHAAAEGAPELAMARVEVVDELRGKPALEFISGPVPRGASWTFVCPGVALGPGPEAPLRTGKGGRALCAGKYASPLVAALGAHPSLDGVQTRSAQMARWPMGWGFLGLCVLGLFAAGSLARPRKAG